MVLTRKESRVFKYLWEDEIEQEKSRHQKKWVTFRTQMIAKNVE